MSLRKGFDRRPGPLPDITSDPESVTFAMDIAQPVDPRRLVIRCDAQGNVWAAIRPVETFSAADE